LSIAWDRLVRLMEQNAPSGQGDPGWLLWLKTWANAAHDGQVARHQAAPSSSARHAGEQAGNDTTRT